jgi:AcrR family transcriptional regulator
LTGTAGALSMRAVAAELGIGVMSLYRCVTGREEIERLLTDLIFATVAPAGPYGRHGAGTS